MRFHVLGIGPIGSLVAFHLRRSLPAATHPVSLVVRTKTRARALRKGGGISVEHEGVPVVQGGFDIEVFDPVEEVLHDLVYNKYDQMRLPADNPQTWRRRAGHLSPIENADAAQQPIESLIVCTKAHSTLPAFNRIKARLSAASTVVLLQNGMGVYEQLVAELFRNPLERPQFVLASTTHAARAKGHGDMVQTVHVGVGDVSFAVVPDPAGERDFQRAKYDFRRSFFDRSLSLDDIGPPAPGREARRARGAAPPDRCASLRETVAALANLKHLNAKWQTMEEMQVRLRRKLVVNAVINPLTALAQCSNGALFGDRHSRSMTKKICEEAAAVFAAEAASAAREAGRDAPAAAAADGRTVSAPAGLRARDLQDEVFRICRLTSRNFSSMLQDTWKGQRTEVEYLNGHLHRLGVKFGVPTPCNDMIYDMIRMREGIVPAARL